MNRPPLKPFSTSAEMETGVQSVFDRMNPELAAGFRGMREKRLLDLDNRKGTPA
jgi:oligoendopeptidase F